MMQIHNYAQYWKCALQVNPSTYSGTYRGTDSSLSEEEYNKAILEKCLELEIKVVGIADHGNVSGIDGLRKVLEPQGIVVFPGFEIASNDKTHFVCLFAEDTATEQLNRYLGALDLLDPDNGVRPSRKSAEELVIKVCELGGFIYAAHCTGDNGLLKKKLNHVWQMKELQAAQIPASIDDLVNGNFYHQAFTNSLSEYYRELPMAAINANDISNPQELEDPAATCLIKMTKPCFDSFKKAFMDSASRVKLNSDIPKNYFSCIEKIKVTLGYLDGLEIELSENLNAVIGGRGTGKSTMIECIRYALGRRPIGKDAQKQHDEIIKENLGKVKGKIELKIKSSKINGKHFTISRRYGETISVLDESGNPSTLQPDDLLPRIEIFGQNEILEIANNPENQGNLINRFLDNSQQEIMGKIEAALGKLSENRQKILDTQEKIAAIEDEASQLQKLEERIAIYNSLGLEDKLKIIPLLEMEKQLLSRSIEGEAENINASFQAIKDNLPDTAFLGDTAIEKLPHVEVFGKIKKTLDLLNQEAATLLEEWNKKYSSAQKELEKFSSELKGLIKTEEDKLENIFKELPSSEGKTGKQIGLEYQDLLKTRQRIRPQKAAIQTHKSLLEELRKQRQIILKELSDSRLERSVHYTRALKKLNKKLTGKLNIEIFPEADRYEIINFLLGCKLEGIAEARLAWIKDADDFSPLKLAETIGQGTEALKKTGWRITDTIANALVHLPPEKLLQIEELDLPDLLSIKLNTAHEGAENFRPIANLSTGQKCTAILHLLLLQNQDPLIMDQPEDNLDNAFIADRIVAELRKEKVARQFIFATHNANIPVFGDAEWIGILEAVDNQAQMPPEAQGAIDIKNISDKAAIILEGGKIAFKQREVKYGF